jgi:hypothetical protein
MTKPRAMARGFVDPENRPAGAASFTAESDSIQSRGSARIGDVEAMSD